MNIWQGIIVGQMTPHILQEKYITQGAKKKTNQTLQIIGHVVAEFYANKRSMHGRRQFVVSNVTLQ
jgi:hypothetical protein